MVSMVKRNAAVNADGFGMGWWNDGVSAEPVIFTSISPAEHNVNLSRIAGKTKSRVVFGHARAASPGSAIHEMNCHPFQFGRFAFMHNGGIANFRVLRRPLQNMLSQSSFNMIAGTTDSELAGALFVDQLPDRNPFIPHPPNAITAALRRTIHLIHDLAQQYGDPNNPVTKISSLNFAVSDGHTTVCSRFRDSTIEDPPSLYYCKYTKHVMVEGESEFHFQEGEAILGVLIGSEPLSYDASIWHLVPKNHLVTIVHNQDGHPQDHGKSEHAEEFIPASGAAPNASSEQTTQKDTTSLKMEPVFDVHSTVRKILARWKSLTFNKKRFYYASATASTTATSSSTLSNSAQMMAPKVSASIGPAPTPPVEANAAGPVTIQSLLNTTSPEQLKNLFEQLQRLPQLSHMMAPSPLFDQPVKSSKSAPAESALSSTSSTYGSSNALID